MTECPETDKEREYYTNRWGNFAFASRFELLRAIEVLKILQTLKFENPPTICDLGCGSGWITGMLGCFGPTWGVDLSDTSLAAQRYPYCNFISTNILNWNYPSEKFDVVVSVEVIEHIKRGMQERYVDIIHNILKPGGHLILTTPNAKTMRAFPQGGIEYSNQPVEEWNTKKEILALLSRRLKVKLIRSFLFGFGSRKNYRIVNSQKLLALFNIFYLGDLYKNIVLRCNYGLHFVIHATKRGGPLFSDSRIK